MVQYAPAFSEISTLGEHATRSANTVYRSDADAMFAELPRTVIEFAVSQVFGVAADELRLGTRGREKAAHARQAAMYIAHVVCGLTLTDAGRLFSRDRTTVAHACGMVEDRRDDPTFDRVLELLERIVSEVMRRQSRHQPNRLY